MIKCIIEKQLIIYFLIFVYRRIYIMSYVEKQLEKVVKQNANEPEFIQAVTEVLNSLKPVIEQNPQYENFSLVLRPYTSSFLYDDQ